MTDDLDTAADWDLQISNCLMGAGAVLDHATKQFLEGYVGQEEADAASTLAEAWRDLAQQWLDRQRQEIELADSFDEYEDEEAEVPAEVES